MSIFDSSNFKVEKLNSIFYNCLLWSSLAQSRSTAVYWIWGKLAYFNCSSFKDDLILFDSLILLESFIFLAQFLFEWVMLVVLYYTSYWNFSSLNVYLVKTVLLKVLKSSLKSSLLKQPAYSHIQIFICRNVE